MVGGMSSSAFNASTASISLITCRRLDPDQGRLHVRKQKLEQHMKHRTASSWMVLKESRSHVPCGADHQEVRIKVP